MKALQLVAWIATEGVTNANFYIMIEIFVFFNDEYYITTSNLVDGNPYIDHVGYSESAVY